MDFSALERVVKRSQGFVELRYHKRTSHAFWVQKGRVDAADAAVVEGLGVRVLVDGQWGFVATTDMTDGGIEKAVAHAQSQAKTLAKAAGARKRSLPEARLAKGVFERPGYHELMTMPAADKLSTVVESERQLAAASNRIHSAACGYTEYLEEKAVFTSDGAAAVSRLAQPEFRLRSIAENKGEQSNFMIGAGVSGGWRELFAHAALEDVVQQTARFSIDLLAAPYPEAGQKTVILAPSLVGLLCHEAVGHTVEADYVASGSVAKGKLGQKVASDLVSLVDTGLSFQGETAVGMLPFDDEGVLTEETKIIDAGTLTSYLHNRESAAEFGVPATGNGRAFMYYDEPLIRMRNTCMLPGKQTLEEMIAGVEDGYLLAGSGGGQADANGEFMFGTQYAWRIENGKKTQLLQGATVSGLAFDVLKSVDAVSKEFAWDMGWGHCGKGQSAKVDGGGPYVRCRLHIGGQEG